MRIGTVILVYLIFLTSCVEPFDFVVENEQPELVIEAQISNKSYAETLDYPSDGRYFTVVLRRTSDVINIRDEVVSGASVILQDDSGQEWTYNEVLPGSGQYFLVDQTFKAFDDKKYRLLIQISEEESYESSWEQLPSPAPGMGEICFEEIERYKTLYEAGKEVLKTVPAVSTNIELPKTNFSYPLFYRWNFEPYWAFVSPLASTTGNDSCWITSEYYLTDYELQIDNVGGYSKDLFVVDVPQNDRILVDFSVLITQYVISEPFYYFWEELKKQTHRGSIFDAPPYNLQTNFISITDQSRKVSGYFGVVREQASRWYFNIHDLSYYVENYLYRVCTTYGLDPGPECFNCLGYPNGTATTEKPEWWRR